MQQTPCLLRELPTNLNPADEVGVITGLSDAQLVQAVGEAISRPKANGGNSYTLHAPMELLARATLLPLVPPKTRGVAQMRIAGIAALYATQGDEIAASSQIIEAIPDAKKALIDSLREYDPGRADAALIALDHFPSGLNRGIPF